MTERRMSGLLLGEHKIVRIVREAMIEWLEVTLGRRLTEDEVNHVIFGEAGRYLQERIGDNGR